MEDLSLHVLDIAENAIRSLASRIEITIVEDRENDLLTIEIRDDGRGMDEETTERALDPFFTTQTTRRIGLGLSLFAQSARESEGDIGLSSKLGKGTTVQATFRHSHPDRKPLGDMGETMRTLITGHPDLHFIYEHRAGKARFRLDSREIENAYDPPNY